MLEINIPENWSWKKLDELGEWKSGGTPTKSKTKYWENGSIPWVSPKDMKTHQLTETQDQVTPLSIEDSETKLVDAGSILFVTRSGILEHTLPVALAKTELSFNQDIKSLELNQTVDPEYLLLCIRACEDDILRSCTKDGTTVASINSEDLYSYKIPVPPFDEQQQISNRVSAILSRVEVGLNEAKAVGEQVDSYWLSYLRAAFRGELTEKFAKTSEQVTSLKKQSGEWETPESWVWSTIGETCQLVNGGTPKTSIDEYYGGEIPFLKSGGLTDGPVYNPTEYITEAGRLNTSTEIVPEGTLLIALYGATTGKLGVLKIDTTINQAICAITPPEYLDTRYLFWYLRRYRGKILASKSGGAQGNISQTKVKKVPLPIPPIKEQKNIADELDRTHSLLDDVENSISVSIKKGERLEQAILKKAVSGNLIQYETGTSKVNQEEAAVKSTESEQLTLKDVN